MDPTSNLKPFTYAPYIINAILLSGEIPLTFGDDDPKSG